MNAYAHPWLLAIGHWPLAQGLAQEYDCQTTPHHASSLANYFLFPPFFSLLIVGCEQPGFGLNGHVQNGGFQGSGPSHRRLSVRRSEGR